MSARPSRLARALAALELLARFAAAVVVSGFSTVAVILRAALRRGPPPRPGFLRIPLSVTSERWATLEACLVTLTPGTTVVEIDLARRQLVLHVLDVSDPERVRAAIRRDFEAAIERLAGGVGA